MNFFESILLGAIEGITEFMPISSTAHLILFSDLLKINQTQFQKFFEVFIQTGAILAVFALYFDYLKKNRYLLLKILVSFLPTAFFGIFLYKLIKNIFFDSRPLIIFSLIFVGIIFLLVEFLIKKNYLKVDREIDELNYKSAFLIGLFQSVAVLPGVSRAGAVILGMLFLGFKRKDAVFYSFLLALPTIVSASLFDFYKSGMHLAFSAREIIYLLSGFLSSFVFALFSIKFLISYVQTHKLTAFGFYRIIIGILFILFIYF